MAMRLFFLSILILLCVQGSTAFFCELFNTCPKTTTTDPIASATPITPQNSTYVPSSTDAPTAVIPPSSTLFVTTSSPVSNLIPSPISSALTTPSSTSSYTPSSTPSFTSLSSPLSTSTPPPSSTFINTRTLETTETISPTPSATPTQATASKGSNTGVIVGSVCGFVAIIGAGFAYAFFSKTRRRKNRDERLYSQSNDNNGNDSPQDLYNRPSPALVASAAAAADNIYSLNQWNNNASYNYAPQAPMSAVAKHNPYYSTAPVSQMGYPTSNPYFNNVHPQYYSHNAAYYDQQQHYDRHYSDSQKQEYEPYAQHQTPVLAGTIIPLTTSSNVYSVPHSYSNEPSSTTNRR